MITTTTHLATALVCFVILVGCEVKDDGHVRAMTVELGITEAQAQAIAGPPSRTVQAADDCKSKDGVRELLYDMVTVYFGGMSESIDGTTALCIDSGGRVIDKLMIQY